MLQVCACYSEDSHGQPPVYDGALRAILLFFIDNFLHYKGKNKKLDSVCLFEVGFHSVALASFELRILLPCPPECRDDSYILMPGSAFTFLVLRKNQTEGSSVLLGDLG